MPCLHTCIISIIEHIGLKYQIFHSITTDKMRSTSSAQRSLFSPLSKRQETQVQDQAVVRKRLADMLRKVEPDSCFQQLYDMKRLRPPTKATPTQLPESLKEQAQCCQELPQILQLTNCTR